MEEATMTTDHEMGPGLDFIIHLVVWGMTNRVTQPKKKNLIDIVCLYARAYV